MKSRRSLLSTVKYLTGSLLAVSLLAACGGADVPSRENSEAPALRVWTASKKCNQIENAFTVTPGETCLTSDGVVFARVETKNSKGWLDTKNNLTWADAFKDQPAKRSWSAAQTYCAGKGLRLPSKADFDLSESSGLRDVFDKKYPHNNQGWWDHHNGVWYGWPGRVAYWTSTLDERKDPKWPTSGTRFAYIYQVSSSFTEGNLPINFSGGPSQGEEISYGDVYVVCVAN